MLAGSGPAVLSRLAVADDLRAGRLVAVDVEGASIQRSLRAVWSRATVPSSGVMALLEQLGLPAPGRRRRRAGVPPVG